MPEEIDTIIEDRPPSLPSASEQAPATTSNRRSIPSLSVLALIGLIIVALIPRLILALQLDIVTDEVVYLWGGKVYLPLITHLNFGSELWNTANYEHPPLVKILIGICIELNNVLGHPLAELLAGRLPSILMGTILVLAVYWLGRKPFGHTIALIAALALAVSPWLVYFSAIAYLDMTMAAFITMAYLLLWHATRRPWLFPIVAILVGLGAASKYPAVFVVPGIVLYTAYYYFLLRPMMPVEQRPALPWRWWIATVVIAPLSFLIVDPAIWASPIGRLLHSFAFETAHSANGHPIYIAGETLTHVPKWTIAYMVFTKMSAFLTIPAVFFVIFVLILLVRFHLRKARLDISRAASYAYLVIWFISILGMFSLLNIAVGSHYYLPLAPSLAIAGVSGLAVIINYLASLASLVWKKSPITDEATEVSPSSDATTDNLAETTPDPTSDAVDKNDPAIAPDEVSEDSFNKISAAPGAQHNKKTVNPRVLIPTLLLAILAIVPGLIGVATVHGAEGYTNEFFNNDENTQMQVAYPDYREALLWIETKTSDHDQIGLIGSALNGYSTNSNWFYYNADLTKRFDLYQIDPTNTSTKSSNAVNLQRLNKLAAGDYSYLVWPKDVLQRGNAWPAQYQLVHTIMGGNTIYCYILQRKS